MRDKKYKNRINCEELKIRQSKKEKKQNAQILITRKTICFLKEKKGAES